MKDDFIYRLAMIAVFSVVLLAGSNLFTISKVKAQSIEENKKAIVVVSFGTTYAEARKSCIETVESRIQQAFPEYDVYRAFTSKIVMKRLAERDNIHVDDLETVLAKLQNEGYTEVIIQTTHLTPGEEYEKKVLVVAMRFKEIFPKIVVGRPLLYFKGDDGQPDDFAIAAEALKWQMPSELSEGQAVVFMGHGSPNQHNPAYELMQQHFDEANINAMVGVVEETDHPSFPDVQKSLAAKNMKKIVLMPLLLVAGDHANNDMAGTEKESWKNQLLGQGYEVETYLHGLGENTAIQDIYVQHVRDAIAGLE
ncbi:MAG: Sirohydrochlorin cobaltochelatase [Firmicutes bacterium]|nr:Sirohydrochlorin cobaltochelatase [Bacillota bacterium]